MRELLGMHALLRYPVSDYPNRTRKWRWSNSKAVRGNVLVDVEQGVLERDLVLLSGFPFLLLCQTGRRRVMGMNERVMEGERQEGQERQETKRETMSMGRDSVGVQGKGVRPSSWAKGSTAQDKRCMSACAVPTTCMIIIIIPPRVL